MGVSIVLLMGLPGSGKTSLAHNLNSRRANAEVVLVSYDALVPSAIQMLMSEETRQWRQCREVICSGIETFLSFVVGTQQSFQNNRVAVGEMELSSMDVVRKIQEQVDWFRVTVDAELIRCDDSVEKRDVVVVVDDNFYYQSMRYEYFQLARKYKVGFCVFYLKSPMALALKRNRERETPVPDSVVEKMAAKLEEPQPLKNHWEQMSFVINWQSQGNVLEMVWEIIAMSLQNPVQLPPDNSAERDEDRAICASNSLHKADGLLRKMVGERVKEAKSVKDSKEEFTTVCQRLNEARAEVMKAIKKGELDIATKDNKMSDPDKVNELESTVSKFFCIRLEAKQQSTQSTLYEK